MSKFEEDEGMERFEATAEEKYEIMLKETCPFYRTFDIIAHYCDLNVLEEYVNYIDIIWNNVYEMQKKILKAKLSTTKKTFNYIGPTSIVKSSFFRPQESKTMELINSIRNLISFIKEKTSYFSKRIVNEINNYLKNQMKFWEEQIIVPDGCKVTNIVKEWSTRSVQLNKRLSEIRKIRETNNLSLLDRVRTFIGFDISFKIKDKYNYFNDIKEIKAISNEKYTISNHILKLITG